MRELSYPTARRADVAEVLHGELVADPYRWLEDPDSPETRAFVEAQNELAESFLAAAGGRDEIRERLERLWDYPRVSVPIERGGRFFEFRNSGLQNQPVLFVASEPLAPGRPLLDPNGLAADGTVAVSGIEVSEDGTLLAYATSAAGSDWMTWRVREVETGRDREDLVEWSKFSGAAWRKDGSGFYYGGYDPPPPGEELVAEAGLQRLLFHRLGSAQSDDELVWERPEEPEWLAFGSVTDDDRYLVVSVERGTFPENQLHVLDLAAPGAGFVALVGDLSAKATLVANVGKTFYLLTDRAAERQRVVAVELDDPDPTRWREVVPEHADTLLGVEHFGGRLVAHYLSDARSRLVVYGFDGARLAEVPLGGVVTVQGLEGRPASRTVLVQVASFTESGSILAYDLDSAEVRLLRPSAATFDPAPFVTEQVFVTSADGTRVPLFLTRRRDATPDGESRVLLYGYGGFEVPITPSFSVTWAAWLERGGMLAVANLRGGGEYGRSWYDAGRLENKQNVFDDFCACASWLASSGWSRAGLVAMNGASNGGLLVGACLTQHPELIGAAVPEVGVLDVLRFHLFTIGWAWKSDYGDPDDPEQFAWARAYSPLHNLVPGTAYPATMVMTGDHDDRVVPGHSLKFAAALQAAQGGDAPVLCRVETSAGHGAGKPTAKVIAERADFLAFLEATLR